MIIGEKYQTYIGEDLVILRLLRSYTEGDEEKFIFLDKNNNKVKMGYEEAHNMIRLNPDSLMNLMVTSTKDGKKDVYLCIEMSNKSVKDSKMPDLIIRQDIYSYSKNFLSGNEIYVGDCIRKETAPDAETYNALFEFNNIITSASVALYVDDTMNEISRLLNQAKFKPFNQALKEIKSNNTKKYSEIIGYEDNLIDLMNNNSFITNYKALYNIIQLDFPINLGNNVTDDGVVTLNEKQIAILENHYIMKKIKDVTVLKYDKDIDVGKVVASDTHIMVSDMYGIIYLISYCVVGEIFTEETNDVVNIFNKLLYK